MNISKKQKKITQEYNYLKDKIYQIEKLREHDRSAETWQILRTLKKEKLLYKDKIEKENLYISKT